MSCSCNHHHCEKKENHLLFFIRLGISCSLFIISFFLKDIWQLSTYLIAYFIIGYDVLWNASKNIIHGKLFDEHFLMALATVVAMIIQEFPEAVAVMLFYQVGEFFQDMAVDKSKDSIHNLFDLSEEKVSKIVEGKEEIVLAEDVQEKDILLIKKGEKVPVDGKIYQGKGLLDTSSITGEAMPVFLKENDSIYSGYINLEQSFQMIATKAYHDSTSYKVSCMIQEASKNQAESEKFITKFSKVYTPIVILLALLIAFLPPLFLGFSTYFTIYLHRALLFMVISCPCALVISVPLSFFAGIGKSAQKGILFKGANHLEDLAKVKVAAFDKTGTLTEGKFQVEKIEGENIDYLKSLLYSMEINSNHPIAKSLCEYTKNVEKLKIEDIKEITGKGIQGKYQQHNIFIGNQTNQFQEEATIIFIYEDNQEIGKVTLVDKLKENIAQSIQELKENGIKKTYLFSGDNSAIVQKVAQEAKIDVSYGRLLPEEKVAHMEKLKHSVYCGDGINDAAVLLKADVGVAMGKKGSDIAIQAADVVFMDDNIQNLNTAIKIAKKTMRIVKENIIFALSIKILILILGAFGWTWMWVAIFADVGVSLLAILNSLRLMYGKIK